MGKRRIQERTGRTNERIKVKKVRIWGVKLRPNSPELKKVYLKLERFLKSKGEEAMIEKESGNMIGIKGGQMKEVLKKVDGLISIGGDGTFLGLARESFLSGKTILGVNAGSLGFLTEVSLEEVEEVLEKIILGECVEKERMVMEIELPSSKNEKVYAVNEIAIKGKNVAELVRLELWMDGKYVNTYSGDGLIVATPTGSTAYSLSAEGPILYPFAKNFIFTPICPHSFSQRPLVIPTTFLDIEVRVPAKGRKVVVVVDGQEEHELKRGKGLKIRKAEKGVRVFSNKNNDFFKVLREKLGWGERN